MNNSTMQKYMEAGEKAAAVKKAKTQARTRAKALTESVVDNGANAVLDEIVNMISADPTEARNNKQVLQRNMRELEIAVRSLIQDYTADFDNHAAAKLAQKYLVLRLQRK